MSKFNVSKEDIKRLVLERQLFEQAYSDIEYDTQLIFDSLSLAWFIEGLESEHQVQFPLERANANHLTSVNTIYAFIQQAARLS